ncbi:MULTISPECIES: hypothetical protein [Streptomyces]|uniref:hypothetical protein n=1 Tax=Streptomyces TaxID=1883 RepID=UPI001318FE2E|nr:MULTISPECIES: hypothetical protein [Streptomyces]QGZ50427.1 hypothetical protein GPZ77_20500 [Streptomyces sp. QHH-9511]GGT88354.1 hypothetical protein GCM10010272_36460 [Streptomyces lateritius]
MNLRSSWVAETGQTREDTRLTQIGATNALNPVQVRSGILPGSYDGKYRLSGFWMTNSSAMSATVSEGRAVIQGDVSQGAYPVTLPASETVTFAPGDALYNRVDLVVLRVYDKLYEGNRNEAVIEIVQGFPEQSAKAQPVPARSLPLYEVTVPAGASAGNGGIPWATALKDRRTTVSSVGGILPVEGPVQPGAYPGQYQDTPDAQLQRWDGGKWVAYPQAIGGVVPNSVSSSIQGTYTGQYRDGVGGRLERWTGSAWAPAFPGPYFNDTLTASYTTSTTWVSTLTDRAALSVTFVAPGSRQAILTFGSRIQLVGTGSGAGFMGVRVTQGTTVHRDNSDSYAVVCQSPGNISVSTTQRLHTLTVGATYTVTAYYRTTNSALQAWFNNTYLHVVPQH